MTHEPIWAVVRPQHGLDFIAEFLGKKDTETGPEGYIRYKDATGKSSETWLRMSQITIIRPEQGESHER